jgi:hypothetical protein
MESYQDKNTIVNVTIQNNPNQSNINETKPVNESVKPDENNTGIKSGGNSTFKKLIAIVSLLAAMASIYATFEDEIKSLILSQKDPVHYKSGSARDHYYK